MQRRRGIAAAAVAGLGVVLGAAGVAWGCASVTSPYLEALEPNRGPAGTEVVVKGGNWQPNVALQLTWAPTGQQIGSVYPNSAKSFTTKVTIPAAAETGKDYVHYVRATQGTTVANTPFGVDSPAQEGSPDVPPVEEVTHASTSGGTGTRPESGTEEQQGNQTNTGSQATTGSGGIPAPSSQTADNAAPAQATAASPAPAPAPQSNTSEAHTPARASAPSRGVSLPAPAAPAVVPATEEQSAVPSAATASSDLWGGFNEGPSRLAPSLVDLPASSGSTSPTAVGGMIAVLGIVGLVGGFATAELRRRRVVAGNR